MTLQSLLGKKVVAADGKCVGHIFEFKAEGDPQQGLTPRITDIHVGAAAWLERIRPGGKPMRSVLQIPWSAIAAVDRQVRLKPEWDSARCRASALPPK